MSYFCIIHGISTNFSSVKQHLLSTKPHVLSTLKHKFQQQPTSTLSLFPPTFFILSFMEEIWPSSIFTDPPGDYVFNSAILNDLEKLVQHPALYIIMSALENSPISSIYFTFLIFLLLMLNLSPLWTLPMTILFLSPVLLFRKTFGSNQEKAPVAQQHNSGGSEAIHSGFLVQWFLLPWSEYH